MREVCVVGAGERLAGAQLSAMSETAAENHGVDAASVLAVLVCHDGAEWLESVLVALNSLSVSPGRILAVDTGSQDATPEILAAAAGTSAPRYSTADGHSDGAAPVDVRAGAALVTEADAATATSEETSVESPVANTAGHAHVGAALGVLDGVLELPRRTGFGSAVHAAVEHAQQRWGECGRWLWILHDDSAPEPDCLAALLRSASGDPSVALLGPAQVEWTHPEWVFETGRTVDVGGHLRTDPPAGYPTRVVSLRTPLTGGAAAPARGMGAVPETGSEEKAPGDADAEAGLAGAPDIAVPAVCSAGSLLNRKACTELGGYDDAVPLLGEDVDLGWRAVAAGYRVVCVPSARMRHAAALERGLRTPDAAARERAHTAARAHGLRTALVHAGPWAFLLSVLRLAVLAPLRMLLCWLALRPGAAAAERSVLRWVLGGPAELRSARARRGRARHSRTRRLRRRRRDVLSEAIRARVAHLVRRGVQRELQSGRTVSAVGGESVARSALPGGMRGVSTLAGARRARPFRLAAVAVDPPASAATARAALAPESHRRPSPVPRTASPTVTAAARRTLLVPVERRRILRSILLAPPVLLVAGLFVLGLVCNGPLAHVSRLAGGLHGGHLLPAGDLAATWSDYLSAWHSAGGGTSAPAVPALLVLAVAGTVLAPFGGPSAVVTVLIVGQLPLAGLSAYLASRRVPAPRTYRALAAAAYAVLPAATAAAAHGRLDDVVAHLLTPLVLAGVVTALRPGQQRGNQPGGWLRRTCATALGLAVLGAFSPQCALLLLLLAAGGYVVLPAVRGRRPANGGALRRAVALAVLVLLPIALLLPWPVLVLSHPGLIWHGTGGSGSPPGSLLGVFALNPRGSAVGWGGVLVPLGALVALLLRPSRTALPGLGVALVGLVAAVIVRVVPVTPVAGGSASPGWPGPVLLVTAAGLVWTILRCACDGTPRQVRLPRQLPGRTVLVTTVGLLTVLAAAGMLAGRDGPLRSGASVSGASAHMRAELAGGGGALVLGGDHARFAAGRLPAYGDAALPAPAQASLDHDGAELRSGDTARVRQALARVAARGAGTIVVPDDAGATKLHRAAPNLLRFTAALPDGRPALRVMLPASPVQLLGPDLAHQAWDGRPPSAVERPATTPAQLPGTALRVSGGAQGRMIVLAAADQPGWYATVDGHPAPLAHAWDGQVAVPLPPRASEVRVAFTGTPRDVALLVQGAALLFTVLTALPLGTRGTGRRAL